MLINSSATVKRQRSLSLSKRHLFSKFLTKSDSKKPSPRLQTLISTKIIGMKAAVLEGDDPLLSDRKFEQEPAAAQAKRSLIFDEKSPELLPHHQLPSYSSISHCEESK